MVLNGHGTHVNSDLAFELFQKAAAQDITQAMRHLGYCYYQGCGTRQDFVEAAEQMMKKNIRTNNEFYVAPVFNEMIGSGKKICIYPVAEMRGLGTPEDLHQFLCNNNII